MVRASTSLARGRLTELCRAGLDATTFRRELRERLERVIGFDAYCVNTCDPDTLEVTSSIGDGLSPANARRLFELEASGEDVNRLATLRGPAIASAAKSTRMREIFAPLGLRHELRAPLAIDGATWGFLHLFRAKPFAIDEVVGDLLRDLAMGLRRALRGSDASVLAPGIVLDGKADAAARAWLARFGEDVGGDFPHALYTRRPTRHRLPRGGWVALHPSSLGAITLTAPGRAELAPLLFRAYGLTSREREVAALAASGYANESIAAELGIRPFTVKDHLKSVFAKAGVADRADLARRFA